MVLAGHQGDTSHLSHVAGDRDDVLGRSSWWEADGQGQEA